MILETNREEEQTALYGSYYQRVGADRNDPRLNRGALFQVLATESSLIRALRHIPGPLADVRLLDAGCGSGSRFFEFFRLGLQPENAVGLEMQRRRIDAGKPLLPDVEMVQGDATAMTFQNDSFDVVFESGMFATLLDQDIRSRIATEMLRVCRSGGHILLSDWRTPARGKPHYKALTRGQAGRLFGIGRETDLIATEPGSLVPPVGRFLSRYASLLYFLVAALLPFLVGQVVYVLRKK